MTQGRHFGAPRTRGEGGPHGRAPRPGAGRLMAAALLACLCLAGVAGVAAWLSASSGVSNEFRVGTVEPGILEEFKQGGTVKRDVRVENPSSKQGNVTMYVRARVDVNWVDARGALQVHGPIEGKDYAMTWGTVRDAATVTDAQLAQGCWFKGADGLLYWSRPLKPGDKTDAVVEECTVVSAREGMSLVCDVAAQGIQAEPAEAVGSWGAVSVRDGGHIAPARHA